MTEPVTLESAKLHLRVRGVAEDSLIEDAIVAAREWVESYTGQLLVQRQVVQTFPAFAPYLDLRAWPIITIDSVKYFDSGHVEQVLDATAYSAAYGARPARLTARGYWPRCTGHVTVAATAGYAEGAAPRIFRQAVKQMVGHFYETRGGDDDQRSDRMPERVSKLLNHYRARTL